MKEIKDCIKKHFTVFRCPGERIAGDHDMSSIMWVLSFTSYLYFHFAVIYDYNSILLHQMSLKTNIMRIQAEGKCVCYQAHFNNQLNEQDIQ